MDYLVEQFNECIDQHASFFPFDAGVLDDAGSWCLCAAASVISIFLVVRSVSFTQHNFTVESHRLQMR